MSASTYETNGDQSEPRAQQGETDDRSVAEMLSALTTDASLLMRQEVALAKAEVREEAQRAARGAGMLAAAVVVAFVAVLLASFAIAWGLAAVMQPGVAFLIVGVVYAVVAGGVAFVGRQRLQEMKTSPEETVESVKEDAQWAKQRIR